MARRRSAAGSLADEFGRDKLKLLRWSAPLGAAADAARQRAPGLDTPDQLRSRIAALPPAKFVAAPVHGDLHGANAFVASGSTEVILIDYASMQSEAPVAADAACLDVSVGFPSLIWDAPGDTDELDGEWVRAAYSYPLVPAVPALDGSEAWRPNAIRAVRMVAQHYGPSQPVYAVAVASYLLRFASFDDHATMRARALAYEAACGLVCGAGAALQGAVWTQVP
jgi:hypothetical protein